MSGIVSLAAAAKQLTRTLFSSTQFEGNVLADNDALEVAVHGDWQGPMIESFAGYDVTWRKAA